MPRKTSLTQQEIEKTGTLFLEPFTSATKKHKFQCKYCHAEFMTTPYKIFTQHTKSCGCTSVGKRTGSKYFSGNFIDRCKRGAKLRKIKWSLTLEDIDSVLEKQGFRCALSGRELTYGYIDLNDYTASIDRIDSNLDYKKSNIQILHKDVNMAKQSYEQAYFIKLCREVAEYNES